MIDSEQPGPSVPVRGQQLAMALALAFPTVLTLIYFKLLEPYPSAVQQGGYVIGKCLQFAFPVVWVFVVMRQRASWQWLGKRGIGTGLVFGAAVLVAMFLLYHFWLKSTGYLAGLEQQVTGKVCDMGLGRLWKYAAFGVFCSLAHSLLEEYYWRWFVFGQLRQSCTLAGAIVLSSLGFMAHHVVLLATFFGWDSPLAYLFSLAIAIGGAVWAWLYAWSRSLIGPWLSHVLVDIAIFLIGYDLVRTLFQLTP